MTDISLNKKPGTGGSYREGEKNDEKKDLIKYSA
jgi:hypothetical protein